MEMDVFDFQSTQRFVPLTGSMVTVDCDGEVVNELRLILYKLRWFALILLRKIYFVVLDIMFW